MLITVQIAFVQITFCTNYCFVMFLAAMSSSRSDVVTHSVRSFVTKEFFLSLKSFNCVSRVFKGCLMFKGSFKDVWRKF